MPLVIVPDKRGTGPEQPILTGDHAAHLHESQAGKNREAVFGLPVQPGSTRKSKCLRQEPCRREHRRAGVNMPEAQLQTYRSDSEPEGARLAALAATGILDSEPEASYDAITRLAAEYFQADTVLLKFADESRVWVKSYAGHAVRELPRQNSIFDMVLAEDGPVVISDISMHPVLHQSLLQLKRFDAAFIASVPVRSVENRILGVLTIFCRKNRQGMEPEELRMLESLAGLVTSQLELRRLRRAFTIQSERRLRTSNANAEVANSWPRPHDMRRALDQREFVLYYQPEVDLSTRK